MGLTRRSPKFTTSSPEANSPTLKLSRHWAQLTFLATLFLLVQLFKAPVLPETAAWLVVVICAATALIAGFIQSNQVTATVFIGSLILGLIHLVTAHWPYLIGFFGHPPVIEMLLYGGCLLLAMYCVQNPLPSSERITTNYAWIKICFGILFFYITTKMLGTANAGVTYSIISSLVASTFAVCGLWLHSRRDIIWYLSLGLLVSVGIAAMTMVVLARKPILLVLVGLTCEAAFMLVRSSKPNRTLSHI